MISRLLKTLVVAVALGVFGCNIGIAQTCGTDYPIKEGETLVQIAARVYGNPTQWTVIFYANQDRLGANVSLLGHGYAPILEYTDKYGRKHRNVAAFLPKDGMLTSDGVATFLGAVTRITIAPPRPVSACSAATTCCDRSARHWHSRSA